MKQKINNAEYALDNLKVLKDSITTYASYAEGLSNEVEHGTHAFDDKQSQALQGVACLIDYITNIIAVAKKAEKTKSYRVDVDFQVTKSIYVEAESEEQAEQLVMEKVKDNPYTYCMNPDSCLDSEVSGVCLEEQEDDGQQEEPEQEAKEHKHTVAVVFGKSAVREYCNGDLEALQEDLADGDGSLFVIDFDTEAEKDAYIRGVEDCDGWQAYYVVDDEDLEKMRAIKE